MPFQFVDAQLEHNSDPYYEVKRCIQLLGVGAVVGLSGLVAFVLALMVSKGSSLQGAITALFDVINKPLELLPWAKNIAERQDPVLTIGLMACYWATLGIVLGSIALTVLTLRRKSTRRPPVVPNKRC